jgi:predicted oxidoreductase
VSFVNVNDNKGPGRLWNYTVYADDYVPITGVVRLVTKFGVFLDVKGRRVFVPANCTTDALRDLKEGKPATVQLVEWYAKQEGLID